MKKIDITTDQWIEIHKKLRDKMPLWYIANLKEIFEIHKNEKMIANMRDVREKLKEQQNEQAKK